MLWNMPALEQVLTTILWKDAWRMSSPAFEYSLNTSGMDWGKKNNSDEQEGAKQTIQGLICTWNY